MRPEKVLLVNSWYYIYFLYVKDKTQIRVLFSGFMICSRQVSHKEKLIVI